MRGVFDESRNPLDGKSTEDLDQLVCQLTNPSLNVTGKSHSLDILSIPSDRELTRSPTELSTDIKFKCSLSPQSPKDKKSAKKNWRKRILERKKCQGKIGSCDIDESVELSFDKDTRDVKDMSFDSTSSRSSSGLKSTQVSFNCDSSLDASDLDQQPEARPPFLKKIDDSVDPEQQSEMKAVNMNKKDKESKRQRLKRIITRPLRRSQSACCENEIPSHALFLDSKGSKSKDTMESRAMDLLLYQRLFGEQEDKTKRFHKTFSAESALTEKDELLNNNFSTKSKSKNLAKNMKKRFQFLRRQNTDTVVDQENSFSFFSVTTYDQALQWSRSVEDLLHDKNGLELFLGYLRSEFSEENLEFWIACEEFRSCNESSMTGMAEQIYNNFVVSKAPKEVNLDSDTRMETVLALENPSRDTFDVAQYKIQALMAKDSYPRFLESDLYQFVLENISKA
ncbi:uncharacterized protein LOC143063592 [Mytilus galloprovincialis]|uniref:uncharacterized protein LOC143063592 n=1 Tax=Mytilus galloprovincialis TaxID=29158 RepID=UPI003F7B483C